MPKTCQECGAHLGQQQHVWGCDLALHGGVSL